MKTLNKFSIIISLYFMVTGFANAANHQSYIDRAKVLKSKPVYETVKVAIPEKHCRSRRHGHRSKQYVNSHIPAVRGLFIGAVIDASGGDRSVRHNSDSRHHSHAKRSGKSRCNTIMRYETRQEVVAYRVKYRYKGKKFWTRTAYKPGSTIRIKVSINPVAEQDYSSNVRYDSGAYNG